MFRSTPVRIDLSAKSYRFERLQWLGRACHCWVGCVKLCVDQLSGYEIVIYSAEEDVRIAAELFEQDTGIKVTILSRTSYEEILKLHGRARISIGLSISDAISTSLLEAMIMGSFPIQSGTACANEWVVDGKSGFIVPPDDKDIIAKAIRKALKDDTLVDTAAEINLGIAAERLDQSRIKPQVIKMYQDIYQTLKGIGVRVLIFGGNGMLGHRLCCLLSERMDLWATFREAPATYEFLHVDRRVDHVSVEDKERVKDVLDTVKPEAVVNAVGIVKQRDEAKQAVPSVSINALFPHQLADLCAERGIRVIQVSTDCVFSGIRGNYTELDNPDPVDLYGRSKLLGELNRPGTLTLRSSIVGWQLNTFSSLLSWFALQRGKHIKGYRKAIYSGFSTTVLAQLIGDILLTRPDLSGLYQVASSPISKYDLLDSCSTCWDGGPDHRPRG